MVMKIILTFFLICIFQFFNCQRLNDDIKFEKPDDSIKIRNIENLLSKSEIITQEECNEYALKKYGCIKDYVIIYLYENEPILIDKKNFNIIEEIRSDSTEKTSTFIKKTRIYITDWKNKKFIGKQMIKSLKGIIINDEEYLNKKDFEDIINSNYK